MPDEPQTQAPPDAADNDTSNAPIEPTATQVDSKQFRSSLDAEIDALWAAGAAGTPIDQALDEADEPVAAAIEAKPAEAPKAPEKAADPPSPQIDREAIAREERERIQAENDERERVRKQVEQEQQFRSGYESYIGTENDYRAVDAALRASQRGDSSLLDGLDVVLPNGKKVSQVRPDGQPGLTAGEAASLLDTWDQNRGYEGVMGDRKVAQILSYWDQQTQEALRDADVDGAHVRTFHTPGEQMKAAIETTRAAVTKRLTEAHAAVVTAKDAEIEKLTQQVTSLRNERGNLTSQQRAAQAASPERPGEPATLRRGLPDPEELASMSAEQAFKDGHIERLLQSIPGGLSPRSRRAG